MAAQHLTELLAQVDMPASLRQEVAANLERIERNSLYTVELAAALLHRFRKNPAEAQAVNPLVEQALALVEIPASIEVRRDFAPELPSVYTSDLLVDACVELVTNAVQAMGETGGWLRVVTCQPGREKVSIQISDSGPGIPPEQIARIFDIFFTTSPQGLGFGLWWVKTFVEQQGGQIEVESEPGQGTTFTITLAAHPPLRS
jgi:signal transduction histidine kinase